jgi:hypothetical protein
MHWVIPHYVKIYSPMIYSWICDNMHIQINVLQTRCLLSIVISVASFPVNWDWVNTNVQEVLLYFKTYELLSKEQNKLKQTEKYIYKAFFRCLI